MAWFRLELAGIECGFADGLMIRGTYASLDDPNSIEAIYPKYSMRRLRWHILCKVNPLTSYLNLVEDYDDTPSERVSEHRDLFRESKAYLLAYDLDSLEIGVLIENEASFAPFLFTAISLDMRIFMEIDVQFADIEGAPAPTYDGFWNRAEPMFVRHAARFFVAARSGQYS